jgi:phosphatidate cytidylyltransferase
LVAYIFDYSIMPWLGFGLLCGVCATVGDLFESVIKRSLGVKDMGKIMPGHGGMLDRFDALMFAAPFGAAYIQLVMV